ncbi:MAG: flagellar basal body rod protein FlgB [Alphaproteobacteria bacterium]
MDFSKLTLLDMAKKRMDWLSQREQVLAQNIANSDTPRYRARDLKPQDFQKMVREQALEAHQVKPARTDPAHSLGTLPDRGQFRAEAPLRYDAAPSGNSVVVEDEMLKVSESRGQYELVANIFQKQIALIRLAIGRGNG